MKNSGGQKGPELAYRRIAIVYRPDTSKAFKLAKEMAAWLVKRDIECYTFAEQKVVPRTTKLRSPQAINRLDLVIVIGGDGTYLYAVRLLKGRRTPILGVNMGSLGFLTAIRVQELYSVLELSLKSKMEKRQRSMLSIKVRRGRKFVKEYLALNDLVIERGSLPHLIKMSIYSERFLVSTLKADGLIIASPTGSTAYNLAAGGPILHPEVNALVVTPICPHSLTSRPLIFPDNRTLTFQVNGEGRRAFMTVDGQNVGELTEHESVLVQRSERDHVILRDPEHNYFELLRAKLKFGERE